MAIDPKLWLDKVSCVPLIGIKTNTTFEPAAYILEQIRPVLRRWGADYDEVRVSFDKDFVVHVERSDGFDLKLSGENLICKYFYVSVVEERGHVQPAMVYRNTPRPFEELSKGCATCISEIYAELSKQGNRVVQRVGVVAMGHLDPDAMPPGFESFTRHLFKPWGDKRQAFNVNVVPVLTESSDYSDRCHHQIKWDSEDKDSVVKFQVDWQRKWKTPFSASHGRLREVVDESLVASYAYFGQFGLGDLEYGA